MVAAFLTKQWFNVALLILLALAITTPELGASGGPLHPDALRTAGIVTIFFITGLTLRTREIRAGLTSYRLHLFAQGFGFLFIPAVALLVRAWAPPFMPPEILQGIVALAILPTTITSCVVFTSMAGGNVSGAVFNSVIGNIAGVFLSPLLFGLLIAKATGVQIDWSQLGHILLLIAMPLAAGIALRKPLRPVTNRAGGKLGYVSSAALLVIVFFAFTSAFAPESPLWRWSPQQLTIPFLFLAGLHGVFLFSAWKLSGLFRLQEPDRRAAIFVATQKTVALGLPLLQFFFAERPELAGVVSIPLIFYHPMQLIVAGLLATRLRTRSA